MPCCFLVCSRSRSRRQFILHFDGAQSLFVPNFLLCSNNVFRVHVHIGKCVFEYDCMFDVFADCIFEVLVAGSPLVICASTTMFSFGSPPRKARRATFASSLKPSLPSSTHVSMYVAIKHQAQELWTTVLPARPVNKTLLGDASKNRSKGTDRRRLLPTRHVEHAEQALEK